MEKFLQFWEKLFSNIYFKIINLIVLVFTFIWYFEKREMEPLIGLIFLISTMLASIITDQMTIYKLNEEIAQCKKTNELKSEKFEKEESDREQKKEVDRETYRRFLEVLPTEGSISFIKNNNMAGFSFDLERLRHLYSFRDEFQDAEKEFLDDELEFKKQKLFSLIVQYIRLLAYKTFPTDNGLQTVPPEWEIEQPDEFEKVVKDFHNLADEIVNSHQDLIRTARSKLNI